jgi:hypothetical protein
VLENPTTADYRTLPSPFHRRVHGVALPVGVKVAELSILGSNTPSAAAVLIACRRVMAMESSSELSKHILIYWLSMRKPTEV